MLVVFCFFALPVKEAKALHAGAFLGPSFLSGGGTTTTDMTLGFDLAMNMLPILELGGFYFRTPSVAQTMIGAEANIFPLISHDLYIGGKIGDASLPSGNFLVVAPAVGFDYNLISSFLSVGVDASYYIFTSGSLKELSILANAKIWL